MGGDRNDQQTEPKGTYMSCLPFLFLPHGVSNITGNLATNIHYNIVSLIFPWLRLGDLKQKIKQCPLSIFF